jgi:quinol monooxygenase YgiN
MVTTVVKKDAKAEQIQELTQCRQLAEHSRQEALRLSAEQRRSAEELLLSAKLNEKRALSYHESALKFDQRIAELLANPYQDEQTVSVSSLP